MMNKVKKTQNAEKVRITVTVGRDVYEDIKIQSRKMGLRPSTWMTLVLTTKAKRMDIELKSEENGITR